MATNYREYESRIIDCVVNNKKASANRIANEALDVSKPSEGLKCFLNLLVDEKKLKIIEDGKFTYFTIAEKNCNECEKKSGVIEVGDEEEREVKGYKIKIKKDKSSVVTAPNGKTIELKDDQYLLVINDQPTYKVTTPKDVIAAIIKFTSEMKYVTFSVKNMITASEVSKHDDIILQEKVLLLDIQRVNKGGK